MTGFLPLSLEAQFTLNFGWPRTMEGDVPLTARTPTILDFDRNGDLELSLLTTEARHYIFQHDGANFPGFPLAPFYGNRGDSWERPSHPMTSAVGDVDGDLKPDLVYTTDIGYLHVVKENGREPGDFPVDFGSNRRAGIPAVFDLTRNGVAEIVFHTYSGHPDSLGENAQLHVLNSSGNPLQGWPIGYGYGSTSSPAVGDVDNDGSIEIFLGSGRTIDTPAKLWGWRSDGLRLEGFPVGNFQTIGGSPTLADINADNRLEILIWAAELQGQRRSGVFGWNASGEPLQRFPLLTTTGHPDGQPVVADITGDDFPEIIFGTFNPVGGADIYVWDNRGVPLDSFPVHLASPAVLGSVIVADVSGDGVNDVVAVLAPGDDESGQIGAWDFWGRMVEGFPILAEDYEAASFSGTPTVWDIDRDEDQDLVVVTNDRRVLIFDTPGRISWDYWPTLKGSMARNSLRPMDMPYSAPDRNKHLHPDSPLLYAYPNPFNAATVLAFTSPLPPGWVSITLSDVSGRQVGSLFEGYASSGNLRLPLNAGAEGLSAGTYLVKMETRLYRQSLRLLYAP